MSSSSGTIAHILTEAQLMALRSAYAAQPGELASAAKKAYAAMYPGGSPAFDGFVDSVFTHGDPPVPPSTGINGGDRERSVIAILASRASTRELAIHVYWGLALGLEANDLCQIMLLVGGYSGYGNYTAGLAVVAKTLNALKGLFAADPIELDPLAALRAISVAFPG